MDQRQFYLSKIAEEALEVATAAMKCIHFGNDSWGPNGVRNDDQLDLELHDLEGAIIAANRKGYILGLPRDITKQLAKADKIDRYYKICQEIDTVV